MGPDPPTKIRSCKRTIQIKNPSYLSPCKDENTASFLGGSCGGVRKPNTTGNIQNNQDPNKTLLKKTIFLPESFPFAS